MKVNQFELIEKINQATKSLEEIFSNLVELNMGIGELNCETSPQLSDSISDLNMIIDKINRLAE